MTDAAISTILPYYASHGAALFPIPAGAKDPTGIVGSFKHDYSRDPAQWDRWRSENPGCNFGVVAFASRWIIIDIDTYAAGRDEAWALWCELCNSWGIAPAAPHVQSARGGWHIYFAVPPGIDAAALRQPDAIKKRINVRCTGYTVAAGSTYQGAPYILLSDAPPHPAPEALIKHCTRAATATTNTRTVGTRDHGDVANLLRWLTERQQFADYESWCQIGMALKLEYGDGGRELWELTHDATVTPEVEESKWNSFASEPIAGSVTLSSFLDRAHKIGWRGTVRKSTSALFGDVAEIAAAAGATLAGPFDRSASPMPMAAGQEMLAQLSGPILHDFLAATGDAPTAPLTITDYPTLPPAMAGHGLYEPLQSCIRRIVAMAESTSTWRSTRVTDALAVLSLVHRDVFDAVCRRIRALGRPLADSKIKLAASALSDRVERAFVAQDDWIYDTKGFIEHDNSDNVLVFLGILGCEVRWNAWLERAEIRGGTSEELTWQQWTPIDDTIVAKLRTRGNRTKTRFRPGKDFFWESLLAIAHTNFYDPAVEALAELEAKWDGTPRLVTWLSSACDVPCDPYHQAVARTIIGGLVMRIREPGCKHDYIPVFFGPQGTGKSTLARILALRDEWFSDEIMLGDASKELVLSLAGKCVVEISEMGMRGSTNAAHVKAMLSRQVDRGRTAYARTVSDRHRRNIFIGTTNDDEPLVDPTGNRRFLPVRIDREINLAWLRENVAQIIGEAATAHSRGVDFGLPRNVWSDAADRQEAARSVTDMEALLHEWFAENPHAGRITYVLPQDLIWLARLCGWKNGGATNARGVIMKKLGFRYELITFSGKRTRAWVRSPEPIRPAEISRLGVRYVVAQDSSGRPRVDIRAAEGVSIMQPAPARA